MGIVWAHTGAIGCIVLNAGTQIVITGKLPLIAFVSCTSHVLIHVLQVKTIQINQEMILMIRINQEMILMIRINQELILKIPINQEMILTIREMVLEVTTKMVWLINATVQVCPRCWLCVSHNLLVSYLSQILGTETGLEVSQKMKTAMV